VIAGQGEKGDGLVSTVREGNVSNAETSPFRYTST
jgi:hypothetical protein